MEPGKPQEKTKGVGELLKSAAAALKMRNYPECESICAQALELTEKAKAGDHPSACMALEFMGDALTGMERFAEAALFYKRALEMSDRLFGQDNQVYIQVLFKTAKTYESLSLLEECVPLYERASNLARDHLAYDHPLRDTITEGYAHLLKRVQKRKEKVVEIMDSFRRTKDKMPSFSPGTRVTKEGDEELSLTDEEVASQGGDAVETQKSSHSSNVSAVRGLREKVPITPTSSEATSPLAMVVAAAVLVIGGVVVFFAVQQFMSKPAPPADVSAVTSPSPSGPAATDSGIGAVKQTYSSVDGRKKIKLGERGAILEYGSGEMTLKLGQGSSWDSSKEGEAVTLTEGPNGLIDEQGTVLYPDDAPEHRVRLNMLSVASGLERMFALRGSFPQSADALREMNVEYKNPITGTVEVPVIQNFKGEQGWNPSNPAEKSTFATSFEQGNPWPNEPPLLPGAIHCFVLCKPEESGSATPFRGLVAFIHAGDRNGNILMLENKKAYLLTLTPGGRAATFGLSQLPLVDSSRAVLVIKPQGK
ncbi:MAG TPA: tetratricopeptide repeat protein [Candidatus Obscuribacterales bacterium]